MGATLEKGMGRASSALILVGLVGVGVAAFSYLTSPPTEPRGGIGPKPDAKIHVPMFVEPGLVRPTPRFRFTFDPPEALADLRAEEGLDQVVAGAAGDLQRCAALMRWTRRQWAPGIPSPYPPLNAKIILRDIRRGFTSGFCAQYNYVLAQSLQSLAIPARYVSLIEHEVIEARPPDMGRWICLDPLYDAYYLDDAGRPLSVYEVHRRLREGLPVAPSEGHRIPGVESHWRAFSAFAVWLKNDHVTSPLNFTDLERYKVYFLDDSSASAPLPPAALATFEPVDLYPG